MWWDGNINIRDSTHSEDYASFIFSKGYSYFVRSSYCQFHLNFLFLVFHWGIFLLGSREFYYVDIISSEE